MSEAESSPSEADSKSRTSSPEVSHKSSEKEKDSMDDIPIAQLKKAKEQKKKRKKPEKDTPEEKKDEEKKEEEKPEEETEKAKEQVTRETEKGKEQAEVDFDAFVEEMEEIRDDAALTTKRARKAIAATDKLLKEGPAYGPNEGIAQAWMYMAAVAAAATSSKLDPSAISETEASAFKEIEAQVSVIVGPEEEASVLQAEETPVATEDVSVAREESPPPAAAATLPEIPTSPPTPIPISPSELPEINTPPASPSPTHLPSPPVSPVQSISSPMLTIPSSPPNTLPISSTSSPSPTIPPPISPSSSTSPTLTPSLSIPDLSSLFPPSPSTFISSKPRQKTLASKTKAPSRTQTRAPPKAPAPSIPKPTTTPRLSTQATMKQSLEYLINRQIVFEQEVYRQLNSITLQQQNNHSQLLTAIQNLQNHIPSHSSPISSPTSPPHFPEPTSSPFVISIPDTSSPPTSVIPPTPPTSLVSPLSSPSTSLSTPIPFHRPIIYASITQQQENLARSPFIGILPGVSNPIFLAPQPLQAQYPDPLHSPDPVLTLPSIPPLTVPSPSHVPMPTSLTFTLRQIPAPLPSSAPIFSTFPTTTTPSSPDHAS